MLPTGLFWVEEETLAELVLSFLPAHSLVLAGRVSRCLRKRCAATITSLGFTRENDGLRTAFLLQAVLCVPCEVAARVLAHVVRGEGQFVLWGDDVEIEELPSLNALVEHRFLSIGEDTAEMILDSDFGIAAAPSPLLRDPSGPFASPCYKADREAALAERDAMAVTMTGVHSGTSCARCGGSEQVLFTADVADGENLCAACLGRTLIPRFRFLARHGEGCFLDFKGPYRIPQRLRGTDGTREGLFFSGGAQHAAFGVEFWAEPSLLGRGGVGVDDGDVPPNAWEIATSQCGYEGP